VTDGLFDNEILPLQAKLYNPKEGTLVELDEMHTVDEGMRADATFEMIHGVKPIQEGGLISAANASQICDGASGVLVVNEKGLKLLGSSVKPLARIHHMSVMGHDPVIMLEAPLPATTLAMKKAGMSLDDIDLFEVNEAFAR
jgi:acetyl-CoA C-acetyltransferase